MVTEKVITKYQCPYCDSEYKTEDEAEDCLEQCAEPDQYVQEIDGSIFICEMCGKEWDDEEDAEECEQAHSDNQDLYYGKWICNKEKEALRDAARHPNQTRITTW